MAVSKQRNGPPEWLDDDWLILNHSQLDSWKRCRLQWRLSYIDRLEAITKPDYLSKGLVIHDSLSRFYSVPPAERSDDVLLESLKDSLSKNPDNADDPDFIQSCRRALAAYWQTYGADDEMKIEPEYEVWVPVPGLEKVSFYARIDGLGEGFIVEHKTGSRANVDDLEFFEEQTCLYLWALGQQTGEYWDKVVFNIVSPSGRSPTIERRLVTKLRKEIRWAEERLVNLAKEILTDGRLIYPNWEPFCKYCDFFKLCLSQRQGHSNERVRERYYKRAAPSPGRPHG